MPASYCCTLAWEEVAINFSFSSLFSCQRQQEIVRWGVSRKGLFARNRFYSYRVLIQSCLFIFTTGGERIVCSVQHSINSEQMQAAVQQQLKIRCDGYVWRWGKVYCIMKETSVIIRVITDCTVYDLKETRSCLVFVQWLTTDRRSIKARRQASIMPT